eukprot:symbB.v1.2.007891.t1/scaffold489.1/size197246/9
MCPSPRPSLWWTTWSHEPQHDRREPSENQGLRASECRQLMLRRVCQELQLLPMEGETPSALVPPMAATGQIPSSAISRDASPQSTAQLCKDRESRESNTSASLASVVDEPIHDLPAWLKSEASTPQSKTVADLKNAPAYPDRPDLEEFTEAFKSPQNFDDLYGQQFYGLFLAPETGTYNFQITSNENSEPLGGMVGTATSRGECKGWADWCCQKNLPWIYPRLRISRDFNDTVGAVVAYISEAEVWYEGLFSRTGFAPGPDAWDTFSSQSGDYDMEAGHLYYLEALHKERAQADHFLVGDAPKRHHPAANSGELFQPCDVYEKLS